MLMRRFFAAPRGACLFYRHDKECRAHARLSGQRRYAAADDALRLVTVGARAL